MDLDIDKYFGYKIMLQWKEKNWSGIAEESRKGTGYCKIRRPIPIGQLS